MPFFFEENVVHCTVRLRPSVSSTFAIAHCTLDRNLVNCTVGAL
jgi:hypothetical protein